MRHVLTAVLLTTLAASGTRAGVPLRVVTLNVLQSIGASTSPDAIATGKFLTTLDLDGPGPNSGLSPDIIALQECINSRWGEVLAFRDTHFPGYTAVRVNQFDAGGLHAGLLFRPDITMLDADEIHVGGPRNLQRVTLSIPGADRLLTMYNAHFKAGSSSSDRSQRTLNAQNSGIQIWLDVNTGLDLNDDGVRETPAGHSIFVGDFNSNSNIDGTITGVFTHASNGQPTGVLNLPVESLSGRALGGSPILVTFPTSFSRYDYVCLSPELAAPFDADGNGVFSQDEYNSMGFVYYSGDDNGMRSNGDANATSNASDHRPVVFDFELPSPCPGDTNGDRTVDFVDLNNILGQFGQTGMTLSGDVNRDGGVNFLDLNIVLGSFGATCPD